MQTVTLSQLTGTMGARRGLSRDILRWSYINVLVRGGITSSIHRSDILEPIVRPFVCVIGDAFILIQDNALSKTVLVSMTFLDVEGNNGMNWLTMHPNLNPLEHTWINLSRHIRLRSYHPQNVQNLIDALVQKLQSIQQKGIGSMPRRYQACMNVRGGHISLAPY